MKIAYLTTSYVPSTSANSVQVVKMAEALGRLGHAVRLYATAGPVDADPFEYYGVERAFDLHLESRAAGRIGAARLLAAQMVRLWADGAADLYYGRVARLLLAVAAQGRPLRYEAHALPDAPFRRAVQRALFRLPNFDRLVCISHALAEDYLRAYPELDPARVQVAHDGADPIDMSDPLPDREWPGRPGALQVGYVGGIYPGRGIETLLGAADRLPDADFHIVGGAPETVADWRARGHGSNVHFHGHVPHAVVHRWYARFDVLVAPYGRRVSVHGGGGDISRWMSPLKVFEYMSTGLPILCGDLPVLREVLTDGMNAVLLPPDDIGAWADALGALAADPARRARLGATARADFEAQHTWLRRAAAVVAP